MTKVKRIEDSEFVAQPVAQPVAQTIPTQSHLPISDADIIWDTVKNIEIHLFSLPKQYLHLHATPVTVDPSKLYVTLKASAALPAIEEYVAPFGFTISQVDKFVVIERKK